MIPSRFAAAEGRLSSRNSSVEFSRNPTLRISLLPSAKEAGHREPRSRVPAAERASETRSRRGQGCRARWRSGDGEWDAASEEGRREWTDDMPPPPLLRLSPSPSFPRYLRFSFPLVSPSSLARLNAQSSYLLRLLYERAGFPLVASSLSLSRCARERAAESAQNASDSTRLGVRASPEREKRASREFERADARRRAISQRSARARSLPITRKESPSSEDHVSVFFYSKRAFVRARPKSPRVPRNASERLRSPIEGENTRDRATGTGGCVYRARGVRLRSHRRDDLKRPLEIGKR